MGPKRQSAREMSSHRARGHHRVSELQGAGTSNAQDLEHARK